MRLKEHNLKWIVLCTLVIFSSFTVSFVWKGISDPAKAQNSDIHTVLLWSNGGQIWKFNETTGEIEALLDYNPELGQIGSVFPVSHNIYFLEATGINGFFVRGESRIIRINLETGTPETLFSQNNIYSFRIAEHERFAVVAYYSPDLERLESDSPRFICVLNIETGHCSEVELPQQINRIVWVGAEKFIITNNDASYLIDFDSLQAELLPFIITDAVNAVGDQIILASIVNSSLDTSTAYIGLGYFDIISKQLEPYTLPPELTGQGSTFVNLRMSPKGDYFIFQYGKESKIIQVETGMVVGTFDQSFLNFEWLSNGKSVIARHFPDVGGYPQQIVRYNVITQEIEVLASFDEEVFISTSF
jgi:hypothetical protein